MVVLKTILLAMGLIILAVSGLAIKMFFKKGATFQAKSCCRKSDEPNAGGCGCSG
ncbi:MAG: hypothetical protein PHU27_13360 [Salinivirgaceae bacterium]|nr:hypothetical protein [Salinivirgaceae bacterium]MDD4747112.1 hypothetical protein [Salinivirgaceae bacterium]MDY0281084.1 hypothetical protein [Salinivirgaceae bacterium]